MPPGAEDAAGHKHNKSSSSPPPAAVDFGPASGQKRPPSPAHVLNRSSPESSTPPSTSDDARCTTDVTSSAATGTASGGERGTDESTSSRLLPCQYKRRKVRDSPNGDTDTSGTLTSTTSTEGSERTATSTTYVSSDRPEAVQESGGTTTTQVDSHSSAQEEEPANGIAQNNNELSYADALLQMQLEVAEKREQLAAALLARQQRQERRQGQQYPYPESQAEAEAVVSNIGIGNTADTAAVGGQARQAAAAALANSLRPSLGTVGGPSLTSSNLLRGWQSAVSNTANPGGNTSNPYYLPPSQQAALLASQYGTTCSPYQQPSLLAGLNLTTSATVATPATTNPALLRNLTEAEILQHLQDRNRRLQLSLVSGSSLNDAALFARFQSGLSGSALSSYFPSALGLPSSGMASSLPSAAAAESFHGILVGQSGAPFPASRGQGSIRSMAPPLPNISPAATKAPASQRITRSDGLVCLSSGIPHYTGRLILPMSVPDDPTRLSTYLCFVRSDCVEVFEATDRDVTMRLNSKLIYPRQVGIRCRFCSHIHHRDRSGRSTSFPSSLSRIYQSLTMMLREHFPAVSYAAWY